MTSSPAAADTLSAGYGAFAVPGTMLCTRLGAPAFLAVSLAQWGAVASSMSVLRSAPMFYVLRVLLGLTEAAAYPGVLVSAANQLAAPPSQLTGSAHSHVVPPVPVSHTA